jgi:hypothetical protein
VDCGGDGLAPQEYSGLLAANQAETSRSVRSQSLDSCSNPFRERNTAGKQIDDVRAECEESLDLYQVVNDKLRTELKAANKSIGM